MDLIDKIQALATRLPKQLEHCNTEEATKNALILPFISALGYDVFDPTEVVPEFTADIGTKKGEKVDYAIMKNGNPIIFFECKWSGADLNQAHMSQLFRYFSAVQEIRFGILTNGVVYWFYSDLESPNRIDDKPFFEFNVLDYQERHVTELKKFSKSAFDLEQILTTANELKYTAAIQRIISQEFEQPSDDFVRFFAGRIYSGRITQAIRDQFEKVVGKALKRFLSDSINERLKSALESSSRIELSTKPPLQVEDSKQELDESIVREDKENGIVTTKEEIEAFFVVKSILRDTINPHRVFMRDAKSYCSVVLDDTNRKRICRFYFNRTQKYLELLDNDGKEERIAIDEIDDIYTYAQRIIGVVKNYDLLIGVPINAELAKPSVSTKKREDKTKPSVSNTKSYTGSKPRAYMIKNQRYEADKWIDVMLGVCEFTRQQDQGRFEQAASTLVGRKRPYITSDKSKLRVAKDIPKTNLYLEANLDTDSIVNLCYLLIEGMGYSQDDLTFEVA